MLQRIVCALSVVAVLAAQQPAPPSRSVELLLGKARSLETRGRMDLAVQTWKQLLMVEPGQQDAIAGLARAAKLQGKETEADAYLERLRKSNPANPAIRQIETISKAAKHNPDLDVAAKLAASGESEKAIAIYRRVFGDNPPPADWAVPYYETLAATPGGWEKSTAALEVLSRNNPSAQEYKLSLGRLYTYRPPTRLKGLGLLDAVTGASALQARQAWRQALIWENGSPRSAESLRGYLSRYPDSELEPLSKKQPRTEQAIVGGEELRRAYQALKNDDLSTAQKLFEEAMQKNPRQAGALAGIGFVNMKQQNFAAALKNFEAAASIAPDNRTVRDAVKEAGFWVSMQDGEAALKESRSEDAVALFRKAVNERPANTAATEGYAGALMQRGDYATALPLLERLVKTDSTRLQTWKDLVIAKQFVSDAQSALDTSAKVPPAVARKLKSDLGYLAALAGMQQRTGRSADAATTFAEASALAEKTRSDLPVFLRMQLGSLYLSFGNPGQAVKHYRTAIQSEPSNLDAWEGLLLASNDSGSSAGSALKTLETLPASVHPAAQARPAFLRAVAALEARVNNLDSAESLLKRAQDIETAGGKDASFYTQLQMAQLWLEQGKAAQAAQKFSDLTQAYPENQDVWKGLVTGLQKAGAFDQAMEVVHRIPAGLATALGGDADYVSAVAALYKETGTGDEGLRFLREATARFAAEGRSVPPALTVQMGWMLLNHPGSDRDLFVLLRNARTRTDFPAEQRKALNDIWTAWLTRSADAARTNGDTKHAVSILEAGVRMMPSDVRLQRALAAALLTSGDAKRALSIYQAAGLRDASPSDYVAALGAAMAAQESRMTDTWLKEGLTRYPADTELLSLAGKQAAAKGDFKKAEGFWRLALRGMEAQAKEKVADGLRSGPGGIPDLTTSDPADAAGAVLLSKAGLLPADDSDLRAPVVYRLPWEQKAASGVIETTEIRPYKPDARENESARRTEELVAQVLALEPESPAANEPVLTSSLMPVSVPQRTTKESLNRMLGAIQTQESRSELKRSIEQESKDLKPGIKPARIEDLLPSAPTTTLAALLEPRTSAPSTPESDKIADRIQAMESRNSPYLGIGGGIVSRGGQAGFERMMLQESTLESSTVPIGGLRASIIAKSVFADATAPDGQSLYRFGMLPQGDTFEAPSANGFGAEAQLSGNNFGLRFGSTPRGFAVRNVIGGFRFRPAGGPITLTFDRDSVKDTILSYAGTQDPMSHRVWGGVIANSGNATGNFGDEKSGVYFNLGFQHITGESVQTNRRIDGTLGTYWRLAHTSAGSLNAGVNLFAMHYAKNLRFFTVGHGGYFSPQRFVLFSVPVTWTGKAKRLEYIIATSMGSQAFTEDASPYFPMDALVQGKTGPYYPKLSTSGVNYNLNVESSYQVAENWFLVGYLNVNNARFYSQQSAGVSIRYSFRPQPLGSDLSIPSVPDWRGRQPFGLR